ncbi:MAG: hypothetical protein IPK53_08905 [bacterium]|nr:hypothetical protein [bacterium]
MGWETAVPTFTVSGWCWAIWIIGLKTARPLDYDYGSQPHAVTAVSGGQSFGYDANGNMISRTDLTDAYTQVFDVENRLTSVTKTGVGTTTFAYDANGQRVKTVQPDGRILYTPFPTYEEEVWPVAATTPIVTLTANWQTASTIPPIPPTPCSGRQATPSLAKPAAVGPAASR